MWHGRPARDRHGQDGRATIWLRRRRAALPGSAAMYTEGTASRPPTAKGLADIGVQENEICSRVGAQGGKAEKSKSKGKGQKAKAKSEKPHLQDFLRVWQPKGVLI